jgi:DNA repair protein RadA/Sms
MNKSKLEYVCQTCGSSYPKWLGQCNDCLSWNSLSPLESPKKPQSKHIALTTPKRLHEIKPESIQRIDCQCAEMHRVLGGGLVPGSINLLGGDPGIGKSTLLLQISCRLAEKMTALYVSGEESIEQISLRSQRTKNAKDNLYLLAETDCETILAAAYKLKPKLLIIDSIQTMTSSTLNAIPGSVSQVRYCASQLVRYAKTQCCAIFLVGHVTKDGSLAGPRVLEHMVDTVLYFEGDRQHRYRMLRTVKNRFGPVNELGIFSMNEQGLIAVSNPSELFLANRNHQSPGNAVFCSKEGSRPLLIEIQALADDAQGQIPKRVCVGYDPNRLALLLAIIHRHTGLSTQNKDVFLNVVGGVKIQESAADLAVIAAIISSITQVAIANDTIILGEIGLSGEIRPVAYGLDRITEATKHGFETAWVPKSQKWGPKKPSEIHCHSFHSLQQLLGHLRKTKAHS